MTHRELFIRFNGKGRVGKVGENQGIFIYRVFQKSVPEPSSSGAA